MNHDHMVDRVAAALDVPLAGLARKLNVTRSAVGDWKARNANIPSEHCKAIVIMLEETSDPLTCMDLRPDDWQKWWPELAQQDKEHAA